MSARTTLRDLRHDHCRWVHGEPRGLDTIYCADKVKDGSSYCRRHHAIAYRPATAISEAEIDRLCGSRHEAKPPALDREPSLVELLS